MIGYYIMAKELTVSELSKEKRSALDEKVLGNARKSINEIAEITGLPAPYVAERLDQLLEDRGHLSDRQEERLMLIEMGDMIQEGRERLEGANDKTYAGIYGGIIKNMTLMATRFDSRRALVNSEIDKITSANARLFGEAFDIALTTILDGLREEYPEIKEEKVDSLFDEGMDAAKKRLQKNILN